MKEDKPFIMNKSNKKQPPPLNPKEEKQILDIEELLVDNSNKTIMLDLSELEFDDEPPEKDEIEDEKTEDISGMLKNAPDKVNSIDDLIPKNEKPELDLDDLLEDEPDDDYTMTDEINPSQEKTVMISIEDIIETSPPSNDILEEDILEETLDSAIPSSDKTFIENIDKKISSSSKPDKTNENDSNKYQKYLEMEQKSEKLLDYIIYGKTDEFEKELENFMKDKESNTLDLIKYLFEFYVKKDE